MTLEEMRAAIRLELTEAAESVFADAAITRGIQKCVALMSRLIPKKAVVESTIVIDVSAESITLPATASATAIVNAQKLAGKVDGNTCTIADHTPDVPRRLTVTLTDADASITALTIIVKGYDKEGCYIEETWVLKDLTTTVAIVGDKYFKYVSEVEIDDIAGTATADIDTLSVGTGNAYDADVYLDNKGIAWDSETVTSSPAGTTYVRDTHYRINYLTGGIRYINGGGISAGATLLVTYKLDDRILDMSSLLPKEDYIKIERVEYPVGNDPPTFLTFDPLGEDLLLIKGKDVTLTEDNHIRVRYLKPWTAPATLSEGDYPKHLDDAIIIGATGQVLIFTAEKYVLSAVAALSALTAPTDYSFVKPTSPSLPTAPTAPTAPNLVFTEYTKALDKISDLEAGEAGALVLASAYLTTGVTKITTINDAERVAEKYGEYAERTVVVANAYRELSRGLYDEQMAALDKYARQVSSYASEVNQYASEVSGTIGKYQGEISGENAGINNYSIQVQNYVAQTNEQAMKAEHFLDAAGRYLASGQAKINEFLTMLGVKAELHMAKGSSEQFS